MNRGSASLRFVVVIVVLLVAAGSYFAWKRLMVPAPDNKTIISKPGGRSTTPLVAYVLDGPSQTLKPIEIKTNTSSPEGQCRAVIDALIRLSNEAGNLDEAPLPKGTAVKSVRLKGDTATVDFNDRFNDSRFWGGSEHTYLAVQAIVNSLTEVKGVRRVQLLVEGKSIETLVGHVELSEPLERDDTVIAGRTKGGRS